MKDILGYESFERLYETIEDGKKEVFEFHLPIGKVRHSFIKREISVQIGGEVYYDISTPCSYGGPVICDCHEDEKWELVDEFQRAFQAYCEENKIISEYVRFHPMLSNVLDFTSLYEVECIGETAGINSAFSKQSFANNFIRLEGVLVSKYEYMMPNQLMKMVLAECEEKNGIELIPFNDVMYSIEEEERTFEKINNNERILDFDICVGKKVWNEEIYKEICRVVQIGVDANFFPAYRFKEQYKNKAKNYI